LLQVASGFRKEKTRKEGETKSYQSDETSFVLWGDLECLFPLVLSGLHVLLCDIKGEDLPTPHPNGFVVSQRGRDIPTGGQTIL
jgi:hypothetical protein